MQEYTGADVEQAIAQGLADLKASKEEVFFEVVDKGGSGLLGFGRKPARVKMELKPEVLANRLEAEQTAELFLNNALADDCCPLGVDNDKEDSTGDKNKSQEEIVKVAVGFVAKVMNNLDIHGKMSSYFDEENNLCLDIEGDEVGGAIGRHGETLDAIQYLTNLTVNQGKSEYTRVNIDVAQYRQRRNRNLISNARRMAKRVARSGRSTRLEPMNSAERRQVHKALHNFYGVTTSSEGDEPYRSVVILPSKRR